MGRGGMLHCTSPQNAMWHKTSGGGSESSREKHSYLWLGHLSSEQKQRPHLRQILACTRADGEVCAMLSPVQPSIHYYSSSPDPISEADVGPGRDASSPGWVDQEMTMSFFWVGSYFHHVTWNLLCEERRLRQNPERRQCKKGTKGKFQPRKTTGWVEMKLAWEPIGWGSNLPLPYLVVWPQASHFTCLSVHFCQVLEILSLHICKDSQRCPLSLGVMGKKIPNLESGDLGSSLYLGDQWITQSKAASSADS